MPLLDGSIQILGFDALHDLRKLSPMSTPALQRDRGAWERLSATVRPEGRAFIAGRPVAARRRRVVAFGAPLPPRSGASGLAGEVAMEQADREFGQRGCRQLRRLHRILCRV